MVSKQRAISGTITPLSVRGVVCNEVENEVENEESSSKTFQVDGFGKNQEASGLCEPYLDQEELETKAKSGSVDRCILSGHEAS